MVTLKSSARVNSSPKGNFFSPEYAYLIWQISSYNLISPHFRLTKKLASFKKLSIDKMSKYITSFKKKLSTYRMRKYLASLENFLKMLKNDQKNFTTKNLPSFKKLYTHRMS